MNLQEAVKILKERNRINWQLVDGTEETDFGIFLLREMKAIEVVLKEVEKINTNVIGIEDNKFLDICKDDVIIADTINGKRYLRVVYGSPLQEFDFDGCWCGWDLQNEEVTPLFKLQGTPLIVGNIDDKEIYDKWENGDVER
jgi:hypothetical protein